jgi:sulfur carrier protein ThiS
MVKITVNNINFGERVIEIENDTAADLIKALGANDDAVIIVGEGGEIFTADRKLKDGSRVNVIDVFSGG